MLITNWILLNLGKLWNKNSFYIGLEKGMLGMLGMLTSDNTGMVIYKFCISIWKTIFSIYPIFKINPIYPI